MEISQRREGEILLRLRYPQTRSQELCADYDARVVREWELPGAPRDGLDRTLVHLQLDDERATDQALARLRKDPRVLYAEPNYLVQELSAPNDLHEQLWGLHNREQPGHDIQALAAWQIQTGTGPAGPVVAVLDSGCDYRHPDLAANIWRNSGEIPGNGLDDDQNGVVDDVHGFNAVRKSGDPMDDRSHGTHVHGTIGAAGNNGEGIVGVNWNARMMPVKFLEGGFGDTADAIDGLLYATRMGARLTSNSWGGVNYSQALYDVLASSPALHICAAGNDRNNNDVKPVYPAGYQLPNLIAVAATDRNDQLASFSNFGATSVHVAAPGDSIYSTVPGGYGLKSGTSMAAPHVTGVASLIVSEYPQIDNQALKDRLIFSAERKPHLEHKTVSGGRLHAARALENDQHRPQAIMDLQAAEVTNRQLTLRWTAPGDDLDQGTAAAYELRYSEQPIVDEESFGAAVPVTTVAPKPAGEPEQISFKVQPRAQERPLYVALRAVDNVGQRGEMTTLAPTVPPARVAFAGDAAAGPVWTATGSWGLQTVPGRGPVWTDSPNGDYGLGERSSLTSRPFSLRGFERARLDFECRYDLERSFDKVALEVTNDGEHWTRLATYEGHIGWEEQGYDLTPFCGQDNVQLRFTLTTDQDVCKDGFSLDKLVVTDA